MLRTIQLVGVAILAIVLGLSFVARRNPGVAWLRPFRNVMPELADEHRDRIRRRANVYAGAELILMGLVLPMGYVALTVMFFNDFTAAGITLVAAGSVILIGVGVTAIWRNRRRRPRS